jgi:hypothetical protein
VAGGPLLLGLGRGRSGRCRSRRARGRERSGRRSSCRAPPRREPGHLHAMAASGSEGAAQVIAPSSGRARWCVHCRSSQGPPASPPFASAHGFETGTRSAATGSQHGEGEESIEEMYALFTCKNFSTKNVISNLAAHTCMKY